MSEAVGLEHVVEGAKGKSRSMIPTCPHYIVLGSKVSRKRKFFLLFLEEDVVDHFQRSFIRTHIVKCKNRMYDLPPLVVIARQRLHLKSF